MPCHQWAYSDLCQLLSTINQRLYAELYWEPLPLLISTPITPSMPPAGPDPFLDPPRNTMECPLCQRMSSNGDSGGLWGAPLAASHSQCQQLGSYADGMQVPSAQSPDRVNHIIMLNNLISCYFNCSYEVSLFSFFIMVSLLKHTHTQGNEMCQTDDQGYR